MEVCCNNIMEIYSDELFDLENEEKKIKNLRIQEIIEYKEREKRTLLYLQKVFNDLPGFKSIINKKGNSLKLITHRITKPQSRWVTIAEKKELQNIQIPGQCSTNIFEIKLKDMYSMYLHVLHIIDDYNIDLYKESNEYGYPLFASVKVDKIVDIMLEFQRN
jgi:hypothetical protein